MEITEGVRAYFAGQPTVANLIGGSSALRWYPVTRPENATIPCVVYQIISDPRAYTHEGDTNAPVTRMQLTVWASTYGSLTNVCEAIKDTVSGYRGLMGACEVNGVFIANEVDEYQPDTKLYDRRIDLLIQRYE